MFLLPPYYLHVEQLGCFRATYENIPASWLLFRKCMRFSQQQNSGAHVYARCFETAKHRYMAVMAPVVTIVWQMWAAADPLPGVLAGSEDGLELGHPLLAQPQLSHLPAHRTVSPFTTTYNSGPAMSSNIMFIHVLQRTDHLRRKDDWSLNIDQKSGSEETDPWPGTRN
jgi:hypothetical protein